MKISSDTEEITELRSRLEVAEETLRAIRSGEVDALVVEDGDGARVYTLEGADHPYRELIESIQQGAVSLSCDGTVLYCNRCFTEMLKTPHEKVVGAAVSHFLPESQHEQFTWLLTQGQIRSAQGELQFQASDGKLLPVYVALAPLPLSDMLALCMVVTDLTEQKQHQVLQEASQRKDEFLAMLAHELRNPLAPIQNAVEVLQLIGPIDERVTYAREIIQRQVYHLAHLVDDLLDVSRITLGKVKLQKQPIELATVIARAVETSQPTIDARKHRLRLSLQPKDIRVEADPTRLAQVIGNLLTNAAKYTDKGGEILLATELKDGQVVLRVRDSGMGIPTELLPRVFDLFIQGDRSLDRSEGGLGIGLTLVRRLVELHGGTVEAHSDGPGKGSEFVVRLPSLGDHAAQKKIAIEQAVKCRDRLSILIVEDNKDGADSLGMLLRIMGHQVLVTYTAHEALQTTNTLRPHVILLDIGLPGMSGYDVARRLRKQPEFQSTVLIAMTGYAQEEDKQSSREAGFNYHLVKPVAPDALKGLLDSVEATGTATP